MASYRRSRLPFDRLQTPKMPRRPFAMLPILRRQPVLFQRCSLPFACTEPNTRHSRMHNAQLRRQTVPQQAQQAPRPQAKATTRPQQWLKASPRPQQWLLIGVQGCRLTGFKPLKCLAGRLQCFQSSPSACAVPALQPAVCLHRAQHAPLPHAQRPTSQANGTPTSATGATPAGKSHHKATAMAQGIPAAAAMASYRRSRLPFDRLQTPKMPRRPFAMLPILGRPVAPSPVAVSPCCSSVAAAAMASYRRSRLPFDRLQTPKMPRRPFAMLPILRRPVAPSPVAVSLCCSSVAACRLPAQSPTRATPAYTTPNFAGKRYPNKPNRAPRPQAKATTRPQQWLKASPRPQQWLLIGVQGCRLTGFKPLKCLAGRLQCFQYSAGRLHQAL